MTSASEPLALRRDTEVSVKATDAAERAAVVSEAVRTVDAEALYLQYRALLMAVACRKFGVPGHDAEALLQEVFVSFLQAGSRIDNIRPWLIGATCNASRHYWRQSGRIESLPADFADHSDPRTVDLPERRADELTLQQALSYLQPRCRETLRLHYYEGKTAVEIAVELDTTARYAEKLIHNCLKRVREIYQNIMAGLR